MEYNVESWVLDRAPGSTKARSAEPGHGLGAVTTRRGKRPASSPVVGQPSPDTSGKSCADDGRNTKDASDGNEIGNSDSNNDTTNNGDNGKPTPRKELSAYIKKIKRPSSGPRLDDSPDDNTGSGSITATKQDQQTFHGEGRRESGVALAARRVAMRKRQQKADEEERKQVRRGTHRTHLWATSLRQSWMIHRASKGDF